MARKNMDILVGNILGDATIQPQEKNEQDECDFQRETEYSPKS